LGTLRDGRPINCREQKKKDLSDYKAKQRGTIQRKGQQIKIEGAKDC
jgi:hypothetical protein